MNTLLYLGNIEIRAWGRIWWLVYCEVPRLHLL